MESLILTIIELIRAQIEAKHEFQQSFALDIDDDINSHACFAIGRAYCDYKDEYGEDVLTAATWNGGIIIFDNEQKEIYKKEHSFIYKF